jgi:hypothetical protein
MIKLFLHVFLEVISCLKKLIDKELKEIVDNMPKSLLDYWIENSTKPIDNLQIYTKGFLRWNEFRDKNYHKSIH